MEHLLFQVRTGPPGQGARGAARDGARGVPERVATSFFSQSNGLHEDPGARRGLCGSRVGLRLDSGETRPDRAAFLSNYRRSWPSPRRQAEPTRSGPDRRPGRETLCARGAVGLEGTREPLDAAGRKRSSDAGAPSGPGRARARARFPSPACETRRVRRRESRGAASLSARCWSRRTAECPWSACAGRWRRTSSRTSRCCG